MKTIIETDDEKEAMRLVKSLHMALFIFGVNQLMYKYADDTATEEIREEINLLQEKYNININELIE
jgi:uncharacterized protein YqgV (UPF0045/DUF77 family)